MPHNQRDRTRSVLADGVTLLFPEDAVLEAMLKD